MVWGAVIGAVGGLVAANQAKKGAQSAAGAQVEAAQMGIEAQERATEQLRRDLAPYSSFGVGALGPLAGALGISAPQTFETGLVQSKPLTRPASGVAVQAPTPTPVSQPALSQTGQSVEDLIRQERSNLSRDDQSRLDYYLTEAERIMGRLPQQWGDLKQKDQMMLDSYLHNIKQYSPTRYDQFVNQTAQDIQTQNQQNLLRESGVPEEVIEQTIKGTTYEPNIQSQQQQPMPSFTPQAFDSRAEALMGGSDNPLLKQAISLRQNGGEILKNPLLQAMQEDVTRRLMANQAARGKLGSGGTAESLQQRLIPMALGFREQEISGLTGLGTTLEDLRQREIDQLFRAAGIGQSSAARTGAAGLTGASNIGALQQNIGAAQAQGAMGSALARNQMLGSLIQGAQQFIPQKAPSDTSGLNINPSFNPTVGEIFG